MATKQFTVEISVRCLTKRNYSPMYLVQLVNGKFVVRVRRERIRS